MSLYVRIQSIKSITCYTVAAESLFCTGSTYSITGRDRQHVLQYGALLLL